MFVSFEHERPNKLPMKTEIALWRFRVTSLSIVRGELRHVEWGADCGLCDAHKKYFVEGEGVYVVLVLAKGGVSGVPPDILVVSRVRFSPILSWHGIFHWIVSLLVSPVLWFSITVLGGSVFTSTITEGQPEHNNCIFVTGGFRQAEPGRPKTQNIPVQNKFLRFVFFCASFQSFLIFNHGFAIVIRHSSTLEKHRDTQKPDVPGMLFYSPWQTWPKEIFLSSAVVRFLHSWAGKQWRQHGSRTWPEER